jgi:protein-S-isoprenylcysteine O-methyltransferase Ste14
VSRPGRPPLWALLGTIVFVVVMPGTVIVLVPYWLTGWRVAGTSIMRGTGAALVVAALPLFASFLGRFVWEGHGTPAPVAPTRRLVVGGPFRWTRNPGYIAVVALLLGQALLFGSAAVAVYAVAVGVAFHLFVLLYEEPTLRRTFGAEYDDYCRVVPRWVPRRPRSP